MKTPEMITLAAANTEISATFKDERLRKATERIISIYKQAAKFAEDKNKEIAKVLADVAENKAYEKDGFKSVADYANAIFGINRQNAYALANAGKVYKDENAHPELKAMSPSKIAEVSKVPPEQLKAALDSGEISSKTTQKELRDFATAKKEENPKKGEIVSTYTAVPVGIFPDMSDKTKEELNTPRTLEEWDIYFKEMVEMTHNTPAEVINLPKGKFSDDSAKATINRRLYINRGYSLAVEFFVYTPPVTPKKPKAPKFTKAELLAMLAAMEEEEDDGDTNGSPQILDQEANNMI